MLINIVLYILLTFATAPDAVCLMYTGSFEVVEDDIVLERRLKEVNKLPDG